MVSPATRVNTVRSTADMNSRLSGAEIDENSSSLESPFSTRALWRKSAFNRSAVPAALVDILF